MSLFDLLTRPFSRAPAASTDGAAPTGQAAAAAPAAQPETAPPSWTPAPGTAGWAPRPAASADGAERNNQAPLRAAAAAVKPQDDPKTRGMLAARSLDVIRLGVDQRLMALSSANTDVRRSETELGRELYALAPSLSLDQRQRFADAYRARHHEVYDRATDAAHDLARYVRDQAPAIPQAVADLAGHPAQTAVTTLPGAVRESIDAAAGALETYVSQAPRADTELQRTLREIGGRYGGLAGAPAPGLPGEVPAGLNITPRAALGATGQAIDIAADLARFGTLAEQAGTAFGVLAGVAGAVNNTTRVVEGHNTTASEIGLAGNALEIAGGIAVLGGVTVAGVSIGVPVAIAGGIIAGGAQLYSTIADHGQAKRELIDTLQRAGLDSAHASALAQAKPAALRRLSELGLTQPQIAELSALAPGIVGVHESQAGSLIGAGRRFGLGPEQIIALAGELKRRGALPDAAFDSWIRVIQGSPQLQPAQQLEDMRRGFEANESSRVLADLLQKRS
jgi:hypothetical protein